MNRINAAFLWSGSQTRQGLHPIAWDTITRPIPKGGLGIREIATQSKAHLTQLVWRFTTEPNSYWGTILTRKYLQTCSFRYCTKTPKDSTLWRKMLALKHHIFDQLRWSVGTGVNIDAIQDTWIPGNDSGQPQFYTLPPNGPANIQRVSDLIMKDHHQRPRWNTQLLHH